MEDNYNAGGDFDKEELEKTKQKIDTIIKETSANIKVPHTIEGLMDYVEQLVEGTKDRFMNEIPELGDWDNDKDQVVYLDGLDRFVAREFYDDE